MFPVSCTYACSVKILYLVGERAEDLPQKHTVGHPVLLPTCTAALASPSSGWGRFLGLAACPAQLVSCCHRGSCSGALAPAHPSSAARWGASSADGLTSVPPAAAVRTKFPGVFPKFPELSLSDTWKGGRRGSLLGSLWCFS